MRVIGIRWGKEKRSCNYAVHQKLEASKKYSAKHMHQNTTASYRSARASPTLHCTHESNRIEFTCIKCSQKLVWGIDIFLRFDDSQQIQFFQKLNCILMRLHFRASSKLIGTIFNGVSIQTTEKLNMLFFTCSISVLHSPSLFRFPAPSTSTLRASVRKFWLF